MARRMPKIIACPELSGCSMDVESVGTIVSTRCVAAAQDRVFRAHIDPIQLARWWGPNGLTCTFHEFNPVAGGRWRFIMHGPDGTNYPIEKSFIAVEPPIRIVLRQLGGMHTFTMTVNFAPSADGTRVTWHMVFDSPEEGERVRAFIVAANEQNFDRLQSLLVNSEDFPVTA